MPKVKIVSVLADNRPGTLAKICAELARRRNNVLALYAPEGDGAGPLKVLAADPDGARWQLKQLKYDCYVEEALSLELDNKPGSFAKACSKLARAGVNLRYAFVSTPPAARKAMIVLGVTDMDGAVAALHR